MFKVISFAATVAIAGSVLVSCSSSSKEVSFKADVRPILETRCSECHTPPNGAGFQKTQLDLSSYEGLMKGTKHGPIVVAHSAVSSTLNRLVEGKADPSIKMPHGKSDLPEAEKATLRNWVDQGAKNN